MKLTTFQIDTIRLIKRSKTDENGWAQCTDKIYPYIKQMPVDLVECDDAKKKVRLTEEGKIVAKWLC